MKRRLAELAAEDVEKWGKTLVRIYEKQGAMAFAKYQFSIAKMILLKPDEELGQKLLEYTKHIPNPRDVLLGSLIEIMRNDSTNVDSRILAVDGLCVLYPKRMPYSQYTQDVFEKIMTNAICSSQDAGFQNALKEAMLCT